MFRVLQGGSTVLGSGVEVCVGVKEAFVRPKSCPEW